MNSRWKLTGKHAALVVSGVLVSLLPVLAKEYWEEKAYSQWNEQEAMAMLTNSPEFLKQPMPDFAICISCPVMEPFNSVAYDTLKAKTFLLSRKDKTKKIELKSYSPPKERQDKLAVFMFPRTLNAMPTIELADDEILFVTEMGPSKFRATFKLARMVVNGTLDL